MTPVAITGSPAAATAPPLARSRVRSALRKGVQRGNEDGGLLGAAVLAQGWQRPIVVGNSGTYRLWSVSKPVAAVAVLVEAAATKQRAGRGVEQAMLDAITRSDNCAARRVVVALQQLSGGAAGADVAFRRVLAMAGASTNGDATPAPYVADDASCDRYLAHVAGGLNRAQLEAPALQLGTYEWGVRDEVRFAYALGSGTYGSAGAEVLRLMRRQKARALEGTPLDYTSSLDLPPSGGRFPEAWAPAYKGGWGGHDQDNFIAEQIVILDVDGQTVALAAVFRPNVQPPSDDPGRTPAPRAMETLFRSFRRALQS